MDEMAAASALVGVARSIGGGCSTGPRTVTEIRRDDDDGELYIDVATADLSRAGK